MIEGVVDRVLSLSPLQPGLRLGLAHRPRILAYHGVEDPESFERQIRIIVRDYVPVSLDQVLGAWAGKAALPRRSVLVTFDDGQRTVLEHGLPVLQRHGVPAVVFVVAGYLDSDAPFWWEEVEDLCQRGATMECSPAPAPAVAVRRLKHMPNSRRLEVIQEMRDSAGGEPLKKPQLRAEELAQLRAGGVEIGNHTLTHPCLDACDDAGVEAEIRGAHERLTEICGVEPRTFAYPNGNYDARAGEVLRDLGYEAAFLFDHRVGAHPPADRLRISRLRANATDSIDRFRIVVSGVHPAVHHGLGRS